MIERIPQRIDHFRYTDQGVILDDVVTQKESAKELLRFKEAILENSSDIIYHLEFDVDFLGNRHVTGEVSTQVILRCQRCMNNFELELHCDVSTAFVQNETEQKLAEDSDYDIFWLAKSEYLDPRVLIEDELFLALPQIAMHALSEVGKSCKAEVVFFEADSEQDDYLKKDNRLDEDNSSLEQVDDNPFAILKQLKSKK
ncbi:MAG: YceD family protein [Thiohalomonas sp.]|nr:YceD family protein [Thiohalomonas sp.]